MSGKYVLSHICIKAPSFYVHLPKAPAESMWDWFMSMHKVLNTEHKK